VREYLYLILLTKSLEPLKGSVSGCEMVRRQNDHQNDSKLSRGARAAQNPHHDRHRFGDRPDSASLSCQVVDTRFSASYCVSRGEFQSLRMPRKAKQASSASGGSDRSKASKRKGPQPAATASIDVETKVLRGMIRLRPIGYVDSGQLIAAPGLQARLRRPVNRLACK